MTLPPTGNNLGIVLYQKGNPQTTYTTARGNTADTELITAGYLPMQTGEAAIAGTMYIGLADGLSLQVDINLDGATSIEVRLVASLDGTTYTALQTMNEVSGTVAAAQSLTASAILQTGSNYSTSVCRVEAKVTGAIGANTSVVVRAMLGMSR